MQALPEAIEEARARARQTGLVWCVLDFGGKVGHEAIAENWFYQTPERRKLKAKIEYTTRGEIVENTEAADAYLEELWSSQGLTRQQKRKLRRQLEKAKKQASKQ